MLTSMIKIDDRTWVAQEAVVAITVPRESAENAWKVIVMLVNDRDITFVFPFSHAPEGREHAEAKALAFQQELLEKVWGFGG